MTSKITIDASPDAVFAILADPARHEQIDGTGWVREPIDTAPLTEAGQVFRMAMYHDNHPDKDYEMANRVEILDPSRTIAWQPGQAAPETGELGFGGWVWRYDLAASGSAQTDVTLTYDWSNATREARERFQFPPFEVDKLTESLDNLATLTT